MTPIGATPTRRQSRSGGLAAALLGLAMAVHCEPLDIALYPSEDDPEAGLDATAPDPLDGGPPASRAGDADAAGADPCLPGASPCIACLQAGACTSGSVCHPRSGDCVVPCSSAQPFCPGSAVCSPLGVCVECLDHVQCGAPTAVCDTDRGVCVECVNDDDCTTDPLERPVCMTGRYRCGCESSADCGGATCEAGEQHCEREDEDD